MPLSSITLLAQQAEQKKQLQLQILNKAECHSLEQLEQCEWRVQAAVAGIILQAALAIWTAERVTPQTNSQLQREIRL